MVDIVNAEITMTPSISSGIRYNSNFFGTHDNERSIVTYTFHPSLQSGYKINNFSSSLSYTLNAYTYDGLEDDADYIGHNFRLESQHRSNTGKFEIKISDNFSVSREIPEYDLTTNSVESNTLYKNNILSAETKYQITQRNSLRVAYNNTLYDYEEPFRSDSTEHRLITGISHQLTTRSSTGLTYQYWQNSFDIENYKEKTQQFDIYFSQTMKSLSFSTSIGWQQRSQENIADNSEAFTWRGTIHRHASKNTVIRVDIEVAPNNSLSDDKYISTSAGLNFSHSLSTDLRTEATIAFQNIDYDNTDQEIDRITLETSTAYQATRWLGISGVMGYTSNSSTISNEQFDNYFGMLRIQCTYPL